MSITPAERERIDRELSNRFIELDPLGYFLIRLDLASQELIAEHYANDINDQGLAIDPESGEVLSCKGGNPRRPLATYRGRTAKELGMALTEPDGELQGSLPLSRLDHALYLGRELSRAEHCLNQGIDYVQD